jgi:hypothetical protein
MEKVRILLFTANPDADLMLGEEIRRIEQVLESAELSGVFNLTTVHETRPDDLSHRLDRRRPAIVQFSLHSTQTHVVLAGPEGGRVEVKREGLATVFRDRRGQVRIVVLNACNTKALGQAIRDDVDCVICTNDAPTDVACLDFARKLYRSLGIGNSVQQAFRDARPPTRPGPVPRLSLPGVSVRLQRLHRHGVAGHEAAAGRVAADPPRLRPGRVDGAAGPRAGVRSARTP